MSNVTALSVRLATGIMDMQLNRNILLVFILSFRLQISETTKI